MWIQKTFVFSKRAIAALKSAKLLYKLWWYDKHVYKWNNLKRYLEFRLIVYANSDIDLYNAMKDKRVNDMKKGKAIEFKYFTPLYGEGDGFKTKIHRDLKG